MKNFSVLLCAAAAALVSACGSADSCGGACSCGEITACQFNMRYSEENDGRVISRKSEGADGYEREVRDASHTWPKRMPLIVDFLRYNEVDICGTQELGAQHIAPLMKALGEYACIGRFTGSRPRDHNNIILYKKSSLKLLREGTFWLSDTPEKMSPTFGGGKPRNCNWGLFEHRRTGAVFYYFNTHFHYKGDGVKRKSAELFLKKIREISGDGGAAIIAGGDLNAGESSGAVAYLQSSRILSDARKVCKTRPYGSAFTNNYGYTGRKMLEYPTVEKPHEQGSIDWLFVSPNVEVLKCAIPAECYDGVWLSDHFPLLIKLRVK